MSVNVPIMNNNDLSDCLEGSTLDSKGNRVPDYRFAYFVDVLASCLRNYKDSNNDNSDITLQDFQASRAAKPLLGLGKDFDAQPGKASEYNIHVLHFIRLLVEIKGNVLNNTPSKTGIVDRLNRIKNRYNSIKTDEAQVIRILVDFILDDNRPINLIDTYIFNPTPNYYNFTRWDAYYDRTVNAVGFNMDIRRWAAATLKLKADSLVKKESFDFDSLFNPNPTSTINPNGVQFANINGKLTKIEGGVETAADDKNNFGESCNALGLSSGDCDNFLRNCQKDRPDDCKRFMDGLTGSNFLNMVKQLKYVEPLHIKWVVDKFAWPSYVKDGVRVLKHTNQWLNPNNYKDATEADLMKKIRANTNLVAFFQAVKATTDAFPAILNPNHTGTGVSNPFDVQAQKSNAGKLGLKALITQNPLGLAQYKASFLKVQNMANNNMSSLATTLGISGLLPPAYLVARGQFGGVDSNKVSNSQVQAYMNRLDNGTGFVPSAKYTLKLWDGMMNNLRNRYSMDVSAIDNDVRGYLNNLSDYEGRAHKAIAYVKVFTDNLVADQLNGTQNVPGKLTREVLDELTDVRDNLVGKTAGKTNNFFKNLFELLDRLEKKLDGKN